MPEVWKDIPGYEGRYRVSDLGRVFSHITNRILKPATGAKNKYLRVMLGAGNSQYIHSLVLLAFVGPCPDGMEARHLNDNKLDCRLANLEYGTRGQNNIDRKYNTKAIRFTLEEIQQIKGFLELGYTGTFLAKWFNASHSQIYAIKNGKIHSDV